MFSDALDREAAWLTTTGDGLPSLVAVYDASQVNSGGPFHVVQARTPRTKLSRKRTLFVLRNPSADAYRLTHFASIRSEGTTSILLRIAWPLANAAGSAEAASLEFEQAIDAVLARVAGPPLDKSHGGRFLSVAQGATGIGVAMSDPDDVLGAGEDGVFRAAITYNADDPEQYT